MQIQRSILRFSLLSFILLINISCRKECTDVPKINNESVTIGTQTWCSKNLDISTYQNGDLIPEVQDSVAWSQLTTGAWCYNYNDPANGAKYGKLYNFYAINDPRGLAPIGFHIPTQEDWNILVGYLGGKAIAGAKMKSQTGWDNNGNGTNESGFTALAGGERQNDGYFNGIGSWTCWWSSTEDARIGAWAFEVERFDSKVISNPSYKRDGCAVRCIRD